MSLLKSLTKEPSFKTYIGDVGLHSGVHLKNCIAAGLPSVWLYMKAIRQELNFFSLLKQCKSRPAANKELMYLLYMTNANSEFFPRLPDDLLRLEIPALVLDAQVEITKPDFKLVYGLNRERSMELLRSLVVPNRLIRIGSKSHSVAVMFANDVYSLYHEGCETKAMEFDKLQDCDDALLKAQGRSKDHEASMVVIESFNLAGMPVAKPPIASDFFIKYAKQYTEEQLVDCLFTCVLANDLKSLQLLQTMGVSFDVKKFGVNLLQLAVAQQHTSFELIKFLIQAGIDRRQAIEDLIAKKTAHQGTPRNDEILHFLQADTHPHAMLHSIAAPVHQASPTKRR